MDTPTRIEKMVEALSAQGYTCKVWRDERIYIKQRGNELGYVVVDDDGSTGACKHVRRAGDIARILRDALKSV